MNRRLLPLKKHFFGILLTLASVLGWGQTSTLQLGPSPALFGTANGSTKASTSGTSVTWTVNVTAGAIQNTWNSANYLGQQFGTSTTAWTGTFTAPAISGATITQIDIRANTGGSATLAASVGGTAFSPATQSVVKNSSATDANLATYSFTGNKAGAITITVSGTSNAFYLNRIVITYTTCSAPNTQATNVAGTSTTTTMPLSWTSGNGDNRAVFVAQASSGTPAPIDGTTYTANTAFGSGTQIGTTGWYCVYNGTGNSTTVNGLTPNTAYRVMVVEYNACSGAPKYFTTTGTNNPNNFTTQAQYTVTYNGNGSTGGAIPTDSSSPYVSGSNVTVLGNTGALVRSGYNFAGWTTDAANLGTVYNAGNTFSNITSNTVFYAKWVASGVYSVASGDWSTGSTWNTGTVPTASDEVTVTAGHTVTTSSVITRNNTTTVNGVLALTNQLTGSTAATINGTLQMNSGGYTSTAPIYNTSSILKYNSGGTYGRSVEWNATTGTLGITSGYPYDVQVSNNTILNYANGSSSTFIAAGSVTIDSGSSLYQNYGSGNAGLSVAKDVTVNGNLTLGASSGDLYVGGNFTVGSSANFSSNGRAVFFNGTANQTITKTGGGSIAFDYFVMNKTAGNVVLSSSPATDVSINASSGYVLQLINAGSLDLNGRTMSFNNSGGSIYVDGARTITSAVAGGSIAINQYKYVANNAGVGSLTFDTNVVVNLNANGNLDFGKSGSTYISTLKGTLSINSTTSCFVNTNPPIYATNSLLKYNSGGTSLGRGVEFSTTSGAGYPYHVQVSNNTTVDYPNTASAFSIPLAIAGDLTIDSGSSFYMDYGTGAASGALTVNGNVNIAGNFSLGDTSGGDLNIKGNWTKTGGNFYPNNRAVFFNGSSAQAITGVTAFDYLILNNNAGLSLNNDVTVNNTLTLSSGKITINASNLTINAVSGAGVSNYVITNSTGQLRRNVAALDIIFPVGNSSYNPITFNNSGTADVYGVRVLEGALTTANVNTKTVSRRWVTTEAVAGGSNLSVVAQYNTGEQNTGFNAAVTPKIGFYNGTAWSEVTATAAGTNPFTFTSNANSTPVDLTTGTQYFALGKDDAFIVINRTVTFDKNAIDATGTMTPQSIAYGSTAPLTTNAYTRAGYTFTGWNTLANGTGTAYADGASYTMGNANVTLYAQWTLIKTYELITSVDQLEIGKKYLIVNSASVGAANALSTQGANNRTQAAVTITPTLEITTLTATSNSDTKPFELTLGGTTGAWTFYDAINAGYLFAASSGSNYLRTQTTNDANGVWAITIDGANVASITAQGTNTNKNLKWNSGSSIFSCYSTGQSSVYIFGEKTICSTTPANPNGSITGTTPACSSTTLTYTQGSGQPEVGVTYYWQTSAIGRSTTNNASSPLNVTTSGTYYVRGKNAEGCWSSGASTGYTVVINSQPTITTNPSNAYVQEGATATFTIAGTNLTAPTTIQWQVSTNGGGSWTNISGANAATLSVTSTTVALSGNQYRAVVSTGGCTTVNSTAATLRVYYTPPNNGTSIKGCLGNTSATISWTAASGATANTKYLVFALPGTTAPAMSAASAGNGIDYVANADYTAATTYSTLGKALYNGSGTSVTVTGLTNLSQYTFKVVAYNYDTNTGWASGINTPSSWNASFTIDTPEITSLTATVAPTSSVVSWNVVPSSVGCYEYMVVANQGTVTFTPTGDGTFYTANTVYAGANQVIYKGTGNTVTVTGLTEGLQYCYKVFVREVNSNQWSDGSSVCATTGLTYCTSTGASSNASGILNVTFNTINNTTSSSNGYGDYTTTNTSVVVGNSYNLSVSVNTNGSSYTSYVKAWIDWNRDGTFDNSTEAYVLGTITGSTNGQPNASPYSIVIPNNATIGSVRMRISANTDNALGDYATPCQSFTYGEVEDYTLSIIRPANAEINIKGNNITIQDGEEAPYGLNNTLFASTNIGADSSEKEFIIENLGGGALNLTGTPVVQITGANAGDFVVTLQAANSIAGSGSTVLTSNFKVKFHPTVAGVRTAYVSIANNDSDENPYTFMIQGTGVCSGSYTGNFYPTSGPANTEVKITSAANLTGAIVTYGGVTLTPTSSSSGEIIIKIPVGAVDDNLVVQLSNGCTISQYFDVINTVKTSCDIVGGTLTASDLFISQVTDSGTDAMTYIELYNATGSSVNLGSYNIKIFNNGNASATSTLNLNGVVLANNSSYVVVVGTSNPSPTCTSVYGGDGSLANQSANLLGGVNFNKNEDDTKGHDYIALFNNTTKVDSWGEYQNESWGASLNLGGKGANFSRKSSASLPNVNFSIADWEIQDWGTTCDSQDYSGIGSYTLGVQVLPTITTQPAYSETCEEMLTLSVSASEGVSGGAGLSYQWYELAPNSTGWTLISGAVSSTYSIILADKIGYQYYVQVRENTVTCYIASHAIKIIDNTVTYGATGWSDLPNINRPVIVASNFDVNPADSFEACRLVLNNGIKFSIKEDAFVRVDKGITNNSSGSDFVVENNANLIQVNETNTNSGSITVKRIASLKRQHYNYWGSPVENQNLKTFSPGTLNSRFYTYNEADDLFYWIDPTINTFQKGRGYAIRASNTWSSTVMADFEGVFLGQPHNGIFNLPLAYTTDGTRGHNLVSNPYPSNIDFDALYDLGTNSQLIYKTAYFWTNVNANPEMQGNQYPKTGSINNYAVYSGTGGLSAPYGFVSSGVNTTIGNTGNCPTCKVPNNIIKVGQGFIVKTKKLGSLAFDNTIRSNDGKGKFFNRIAAPQKDRFWLELKTPLNFVSPILVGYVSGATDAFELDYDAPLIIEGADSFYSILGADKLAVQGKQFPMNLNDVIPLGATFYETGTHTISLANKDGVFGTGQPIYLHDKLLDLYVDLQNQNYTFIADKGEVKDRFEITYTERILSTNNQVTKYGLKVYKSGENYVVEADRVFNKVKVFDASGKLVKEWRSGNKYLIVEKRYLPIGINVFSIIFADDIVNKKIISE